MDTSDKKEESSEGKPPADEEAGTDQSGPRIEGAVAMDTDAVVMDTSDKKAVLSEEPGDDNRATDASSSQTESDEGKDMTSVAMDTNEERDAGSRGGADGSSPKDEDTGITVDTDAKKGLSEEKTADVSMAETAEESSDPKGVGDAAMDTTDTEVQSEEKVTDESKPGLDEGKPKDEAQGVTDAAATGDESGPGQQEPTEPGTEATAEDGEDTEKKGKVKVAWREDTEDLPPIVVYFGRCQDCTLRATTKTRNEKTKTDIILCGDCSDLHRDVNIEGETKLDVHEEVNQKTSAEYPIERRVPWECKNRLNYTPGQKRKYILEKYIKRKAFDNLDTDVGEVQKIFEYESVISDGLEKGPGTIEFSIPDFCRPEAISGNHKGGVPVEDDDPFKCGTATKSGNNDEKSGTGVDVDMVDDGDKSGTVPEGDGEKSGTGTKDGGSDEKVGTGDVDVEMVDDGDKSGTLTEGEDGDKSGTPTEGGDSDKKVAVGVDVEMADDSDKGGTLAEGVVADKGSATTEGDIADKESTAPEGHVADKDSTTAEGVAGKDGTTAEGVAGKDGTTAEAVAGKDGTTSEDTPADMSGMATEIDVDASGLSKVQATSDGGNDDKIGSSAEIGDESSMEVIVDAMAETPKGSVTFGGNGLEKVTIDAEDIRFISLANNGPTSFFVQMSVSLGEWQIRNYFFTLKDDTSMFQLVNNARRMMYVVRGETESSALMLNYMEPINRLCKIQVTKKKGLNGQTQEELWTKQYLTTLDPQFIWLKANLSGIEEALLLAFYDFEDKEKDVIDEIRLRYKKKEHWITVHIFTSSGYEYKMEACERNNDKDFHLFKANLTRTPFNPKILKDPPTFVDKLQYLMERLYPVRESTEAEYNEKEKAEKAKRDAKKDLKKEKTEEEIAKDAQDEIAKITGIPASVLAGHLGLETTVEAEPQLPPLGPVDTSDKQPNLRPSAGDKQKPWRELQRAFRNGKKNGFPSDAFDHTGLDTNDISGFEQCINEVQSNYKNGEHEKVIHQANSILEYYKDTKNPKIRQVISERNLLKFIYNINVDMPDKATSPASSLLDSLFGLRKPPVVDTTDVPGLQPRDESQVENWNILRAVFNARTDFPTNAVTEAGMKTPVDFRNYESDVQQAFLLLDFDKVIDVARGMMEVCNQTKNPNIKRLANETNLLKFIFKILFGKEALQDSKSAVARPRPNVVDVVKSQRTVDTSDVPELEPSDEGLKEMWSNFRQVFVARKEFPVDALKDEVCDPNSQEDFNNLAQKIQLDFAMGQYDTVIDVARALLEKFKDSKNEAIKAATAETNLFRFIYKLIFELQ